VTTPGGVPNLPVGALTLDTIASKTQDMTVSGMKGRAVERFSSIFNTSTGLSPASEITPFGILTSIFSGFNSTVANADPADVDGPEDLPGLLVEWIEGIPVIGQFVELFQAILGDYTGDDTTLLAIQDIFAPIRAIVDALTGLAGGTGGLGDFFPDLLGLLGNPTGLGTGSPSLGSLSSIPLLAPLQSLIDGIIGGSSNPLSSLISSLLGTASTASTASSNSSTALSNFTSLINGVVGGTGNPLSSLISSLTGTASTASSASSTASTANTNASSALGNWTTLLGGIPGVSTLSGFLGFLQPTTGKVLIDCRATHIVQTRQEAPVSRISQRHESPSSAACT
jgi:hypothetical protein